MRAPRWAVTIYRTIGSTRSFQTQRRARATHTVEPAPKSSPAQPSPAQHPACVAEQDTPPATTSSPSPPKLVPIGHQITHNTAELSAADEQLLHELTERTRTGGLKLTGEGRLLGKLTKMVVEGAWRASSMIISALRRTTRRAVKAGIPAMVTE